MVTKQVIRNMSLEEIKKNIAEIDRKINHENRRHNGTMAPLRRSRDVYEDVFKEKLEEIRIKVGAVKKM